MIGSLQQIREDKREKNQHQISPCLKRVHLGDEKMTQWLRELVEEPGSVPITHETVHHRLNSSSRDPTPITGLCRQSVQLVHIYVYKQNIHTRKK